MGDKDEDYDQLEAKSPSGAWYTVNLTLMREEGMVRVHYITYQRDNVADQFWSVETVKNYKPLCNWIRVACTLLKDDEWHLLELDKPVCAFFKPNLDDVIARKYKIDKDSWYLQMKSELRAAWYNATLRKIRSQARDVVKGKSGISFDVDWLDGPMKNFREKRLRCKDICILSKKDVRTHPLLLEILRHDGRDMGGAQQDQDKKPSPSSSNLGLPGLSQNCLPDLNQRYEESMWENYTLHKKLSGHSNTAKVEPEPSNVDMKQRGPAEIPDSSSHEAQPLKGKMKLYTEDRAPRFVADIRRNLESNSDASVLESEALVGTAEKSYATKPSTVRASTSAAPERLECVQNFSGKNPVLFCSDDSDGEFEYEFTAESALINPMPSAARPGNVTIEISRDRTYNQQLQVAKFIDKSLYYVLKIENLEVGVQPSDVLAQLLTFNFCDRKQIRSVHVPPMSFPEMDYRVAHVVFLDKETADAAVAFFTQGKNLVLSESGKPWIVSDQAVGYQQLSGLETLLATQDGNNGGSLGALKIGTIAPQPDKAAERQIELFQKQASEIQQMLRRHAEEVEELKAKPIDVRTEVERGLTYQHEKVMQKAHNSAEIQGEKQMNKDSEKSNTQSEPPKEIRTVSYQDMVLKETDLVCLQPRGYLNDRIVEFYFTYLEQMNWYLLWEFCLFVISFWYTQIRGIIRPPFGDIEQQEKDALVNYRSWLGGVTRLSKTRFLLVPLHQDDHWSLAVIRVIRSTEVAVQIFHMDSLSMPHMDPSDTLHNSPLIRRTLERFMELEWMQFFPDAAPSDVKRIHTAQLQVPQQQNGWDCGLFMLYNAKIAIREIKQNGMLRPDSFLSYNPQDASNLRGEIAEMLGELFSESDSHHSEQI